MSCLQDLRFAVSSASKAPGHTATLVLVLGLGIGCATAMFTVVDGVLLRPLPFPHADRLVQVGAVQPPGGDWIGFWSRNHSLEALAVYQSGGLNLRAGDQVDRVYAAAVSSGFFSVLESSPALGRAFRKEEERPGHNRVAILSHRLWSSRFSGDRGALGRAVDLNGVSHTIIGVMPAGFDFPDHADVWVPGNGSVGGLDLGTDLPADVPAPLRHTVLLGRLRAGVPLARAQAEQLALYSEYEREFSRPGGIPQSLHPLQERLVGNLRTPLLTLFAAVIFVLLIGCANAAHLLLARAAGRQREIAVRACLGASRGRIVRQLVTETLALAFAGGGAGVLLAAWCLAAIRVAAPANIPRLATVSIDTRALAFTLAVSLLTGMLAGLAPALQLFAPDLSAALKDAQATASRKGQRLRGAFVVGEIALALVLVAGAGLTLQSLWRLTAVNPGFDPGNVLTAEVGVPAAKYGSAPELAAFHRRLLEDLARIPGVAAAGAIDRLPFGGKGGGYLYVEELRRTVRFSVVAGNYFRAMGIPLLAGRTFTDADHRNSAPVIMVNRELARRLWGDANPTGRQLRVQGGTESAPREVVGVVADIRSQGPQAEGPDRPPEPEFYLPEFQPFSTAPEQLTLVVRTAADPGAAAAALRAVISSLDRELSLFRVRTMTELLSVSTAPPRFRALLLGTFALLAFALAALGVYGVVAYTTVCRTREIGLRISLGAQPRDILRLVIGQGLRLALAGVVIGMMLSLWLTRLMAGLLFGVRAADPLTHAGAALLLITAVLGASMLPALRATRISPVAALKHE